MYKSNPQPEPHMKLYHYDHCPFCVRARMIFGLRGVEVENIILANDDEDTPIGMIGAKQVPILEKDDGTFMGESLDIVHYIDETAGKGRLKTEVSSMRAQISRFVSGNYKNSQPNAVALFLKKAEPGQKTRFLRYTRYINTANEQVIRDLSKQQQELAAQENKINAELTRLKRLQAGVQSALRKQGVHNTAEQNESRRQNAQMAKP